MSFVQVNQIFKMYDIYKKGLIDKFLGIKSRKDAGNISQAPLELIIQ